MEAIPSLCSHLRNGSNRYDIKYCKIDPLHFRTIYWCIQLKQRQKLRQSRAESLMLVSLSSVFPGKQLCSADRPSPTCRRNVHPTIAPCSVMCWNQLVPVCESQQLNIQGSCEWIVKHGH